MEIANKAAGARNAATQRPQHEISINTFTRMADEFDQEFIPVYKEFLATRRRAADAAADFRNLVAFDDPEIVLLTSVDDDLYQRTSVGAHILRTDFGPTSSAFLDALRVLNAAIQADIFTYGEEGFIGCVYSPPRPVAEGGRRSRSVAPVADRDDDEAPGLIAATPEGLRAQLESLLKECFSNVSVNDFGSVMTSFPNNPVACKVATPADGALIVTVESPILLDVPSPSSDLYQLICLLQQDIPFGGLSVVGSSTGDIHIFVRGHMLADQLTAPSLARAVSLIHDTAISHIRRFRRFTPSIGGMTAYGTM